MTSPPIELTVAGKRYGGWQSVEIVRSIEALAGGFTLSLSEQWAGQPKPWPIPDDAECSVLIEGVPVITGFLDSIEPAFDTSTRSITVRGRDRAGDLVDCSAQLGAWSFSNVNVLELAKKIAAPYGVPVTLQASLVSTVTVPKKKYSIDPGDSAAEALGALCKLTGLLAVSDGAGGLVLTRAGTERLATVLVEGQNLLSCRGKFSSSQRFRQYEVMGSHKGRDDVTGAQACGVRGSATDMNARAGRTLIVRPDQGVTPATAKERAEREAAVRAARAEQVTARVQGWAESPFNPVWPMNKLVKLRSPSCRVDGDTLIAGVTLSFSASEGSVTTLDLRNPAAFVPDPTIAKAGAGGNRYWREIVRGV